MSLLANYEGLRHQIEKLVRENEELKKLVRLIRENHELKSAIKMQAGALGISGFSSGLGVFLSPAPAAANEPVLEEVGMRAMAPLADMLSSPQPSSAVGPINMLLSSPGLASQNSTLASFLTSPLSGHLGGPIAMPSSGTLASSLGLPSTGPLTPSSHLGGSIAMPSSGTLASSLGLPSTGPLTPSSHLGGSIAMPSSGTLASSLGLPSTGPLTPSSHLSGPMAVSPTGTLASSLGLPSTGPLTPSSHLSGPMAVSPTGTLASSLGLPSTGPLTPSILLTSTTAPPGVSQNLLAHPMNQVSLSEAPRVRLAEPLQGPHPSAGSGPAATNKVPLSTDHPLPSQDPEPFSVTFVGVPIQTSTPVGTVDARSSMTAFSYSISDARMQPGAPQEQVAAALAPTTPAASPTVTVPPSAPGPVPQATTHHSPSNTTHTAQGTTRVNHSPTRPSPTSHSPPRNPHSPPRTSSSPASVNDPRGPRGPETSRKSILDMERKLAHRKISKFPDSPREPKQLALERLVGEIAFQLDRRILSSIFPERVRLYGFTVSNIPEKIIQASLNPSDHKLDEELCQTLTQRYVSIMNRLQSLGYNGRVHPALTEQLVNAYGILRERPELAVSEGGSYTVDFLQRVLVETVHPSMLTDALLLLSCLSQLAHDDGKPMFIW